MTMKKKSSMILNIILLACLLGIAIKEDYFNKIIHKFSYDKPSFNFEDSQQYQQEMSLYEHYNGKANIVMLGNSITYRANWNELLERSDVINRGIPGDITAGFLSRLDHVIKAKPKVCFIMGGINDINHGIDSDSIVNNLKDIIKKLQENNIKPIIFSILNVAENFPDTQRINSIVDETNSKLEEICKILNVKYININKILSKNSVLKEEYSFDGIHINGKAYKKWSELIMPIIEQNISTLE